MAINSEKLLKIVSGIFNAAPGANFLPELEAFPGTELAFAKEMVATSIFTDSLGGATTPAEIGVVLAGNFGLTADDVAGSPATIAIDFFTDGLTNGVGAGDLVLEAVNFLEDPNLAAEFAPTALLLSNKAAVSAAYSAVKGSTSITVLQAALSGVTGDAALTEAEITALVDNAEGESANPGTFTLTANNTATEGTAQTFTVTASEAVAADTDVVFTVVPDDTAAADQGTSSTNLNDFVQSTFNPVTVTIAAGQTTATFSVTASDDGVTELPENYSVTAAVAGETLNKAVSLQDGQNVNTITLTNTADNITGTSGNDLIAGVVDSGTATSNTYGAADSINGGAGTDTLAITVSEVTGATTLPAADISNVEKISVRNVDVTPDAVTLSASSIQGATEFIADRSTGAVLFTDVTSGAAVGVKGNGTVTNGATTATYEAGATAQVLNISGGTKGTGAIVVNGAAAADPTSLTINSTGAANTVGTITANGTVTTTTINAATSLNATSLAVGTNAAAQSLVVSGAATGVAATTTAAATSAVVLGALDTDFASIDASGLTAGGVSATLSATVAATFTGGAGDDMITTSTSGQTGAVNAGEGNDKLILADATHIDSTAEGAIYTGFEVLSSAAAAIDMDLITGSTITAIEVGAAGSNVTDMNATQAANVTVIGALGATTLGIKDATQVGTADTLALTISDGDTTTSEALVLAGDLTLAGVETITIDAIDDATFGTMANITGMTSLTVTGGGDVSFTTGAHVLESNVAIDFSALTGTSTFNAAAATTNAFAFTGGSGVDTVTDNVIGGNVISTGAGNDVITLTDKTGGTATTNVTGGAGADATTTAMTGNVANDLMKFNFAAGDSVSDSSATGISATLTDTLVGLDGDTLGAAAGASVEFDTEVAATAVTVGASLVAQNVVLGTTTVTNAGDFYVDIVSATAANIYQDTDGDGIIEAGEFAISLTGVQNSTLLAADFTVVGGDLMLITT